MHLMLKLYYSFRSKVEKSSSLPGHLSQLLMVDHLDSALIMVMVMFIDDDVDNNGNVVNPICSSLF